MSIKPYKIPVPDDREVVHGVWNDVLDNLSASFETSDRGNTANKVFIQDQTSDLLSVPFLKELGTFTLVGTLTVDTRSFDAAAGHNIVIGDSVELAKLGSSIFMQAMVINVVTNTITIDSPINYPYTSTDLASRSDINILVDGSITPQVFSILPLPDQSGDMVRVVFSIEGSSDMDFSGFGSNGKLTNGCVLRIKRQDGTFKNILNFKNNGDIISASYDHTFLNPRLGNSTRGFTARLTWGGQTKHGVVVRLDGSIGEELQVVIQDDLDTGVNSKFTMIAQGHELQE